MDIQRKQAVICLMESRMTNGRYLVRGFDRRSAVSMINDVFDYVDMSDQDLAKCVADEVNVTRWPDWVKRMHREKYISEMEKLAQDAHCLHETIRLHEAIRIKESPSR